MKNYMLALIMLFQAFGFSQTYFNSTEIANYTLSKKTDSNNTAKKSEKEDNGTKTDSNESNNIPRYFYFSPIGKFQGGGNDSSANGLNSSTNLFLQLNFTNPNNSIFKNSLFAMPVVLSVNTSLFQLDDKTNNLNAFLHTENRNNFLLAIKPGFVRASGLLFLNVPLEFSAGEIKFNQIGKSLGYSNYLIGFQLIKYFFLEKKDQDEQKYIVISPSIYFSQTNIIPSFFNSGSSIDDYNKLNTFAPMLVPEKTYPHLGFKMEIQFNGFILYGTYKILTRGDVLKQLIPKSQFEYGLQVTADFVKYKISK